MEHQPTCAPDLSPAASAALRPFLDLVEKYTTGENALAPRLPPGCAGEVEARMGEAGVEAAPPAGLCGRGGGPHGGGWRGGQRGSGGLSREGQL